jgi:hypothetical protein
MFLKAICRMFNRISFVAAALVTAALVASPALASTTPVGVWKLDEGSGNHVADSSGNGNDGQLSGGVSWVRGISGSALSFDGSSGEVKISDNTVLEPASTVTVSAWIKQAGNPGSFRYVLAKGANSCIAASYGLYTGPDGGLQFYVSQGHGSVYARSPDAGRQIWDGNWHLAVGTFDGSTIRLYVDGVEVGSGTPWVGTLEYLLPDSNDFYIGNYPGCSDHEFLGAIDDVRVWSQTLGAAEIGGLLPSGGNPPSQTTPPTAGGTTGSGGTQNTGGTSTAGTSTEAKGSTPSIHGAKLSSSIVRIDRDGHEITRGSSGLSISYTESQAASLTVTLLRSEAGVRRGKSCVAPSRHGHGRSCTRFVVISTVMHAERAGRLTVQLSQLLHQRRLSPGTYRLNVTPRAHGTVGKTVSLRFVVRRAAHR